MSSTPVVGIPTPVVSFVSFNARSPPSAPPPSSRVNTVSLLTSVTPTAFTSLVTSTLLGQSQQPSPAIQSTMSTTSIITTTAHSPASLSTPSSSAPLTSARTSSMLSAIPSTIMTTSSGVNQSIASTPETSVQSLTTSTMTASGSTQSPTLTSTPLATATLRTTSSASISTSASGTPFTVTSSPSPSPSSRGSPAEKTKMPLTTVLESTTIFITSTNSQGQVMTNIPPVVTEVITTTGSGGIVITVTQAVVNPTLAPNNSTTENSSFFTNTGAVVGVFVVVGLASASILMWILFAIRHRQRMKRTGQDTAVESVAATGLHRAPLDDDDNDDSPISPTTRHLLASQIGQRSSLLGMGGSDSLPTSARLFDGTVKDGANSHPECPVEHRTNSYPKGYVPARTASPSPRTEPGTDGFGSSRDRKSSYGHTPTYSAGSFEPLLANYLQNMPDQGTSALATEAQQIHSPQHPGRGLDLHRYFGDRSPEDKSRGSSKRQNSCGSSVLRDEDDYTRYVLMVRNIPDDQSQHSL